MPRVREECLACVTKWLQHNNLDVACINELDYNGRYGDSSFRDLQVWQKSMVLAEGVYAFTKRCPRDEQYGLSSQLKRAATSIPANIAEGHARQTGHYVQHLEIALGSEAELQTHLELALRLRLAHSSDVAKLAEAAAEIARMLNGLIASLERSRRNREGL